MVLQHSVHQPVIDPGIIVHNQVPEANNISQVGEEVIRNDAFFIEDQEHIATICRRAERQLGDQMPTDVQADLSAHLKRALDIPPQDPVVRVLLKRRTLDHPQVVHVPTQHRQAGLDDLGTDDHTCPP